MLWLDGKFTETANEVSLLSNSLHYGGAVFEGIRFYEMRSCQRGIFRLSDHIKRLVASATFAGMTCPFSESDLEQAVIQSVLASGLPEGYIRPIVFQGEGLPLTGRLAVHVAVAVTEWPKQPDSVTLQTSQFIRTHPRSTILQAKIAGHYVNSCLASREAKLNGFGDALLLDYEGNVADSTTANVFFVKGKRIFTPTADNIFVGITRDTMLVTLEREGYGVIEKKISLSEAYEADGMFLAGTACEILPVSKLDEVEFCSNNLVEECRRLYSNIVRGET